MSREVEARVAVVAARQHGAVTHRQMLEAGLTRAGVGRRLRSGRIRRLHRGVYLVAPFPLEHTAEMAAVLATPGGVLSHVSAASLWGIRSVPAASSPIHVTVTGNRGRHPGIRVHRVLRLDDEEKTLREGIGVTSVDRTLLDLAVLLHARELESAVARAERAGLTTLDGLRGLVERHRGFPGSVLLRRVLQLPGGPLLTRSAAEENLLALIREAQLPPPECNVRVAHCEVDFLWRRQCVAVEVDGFAYHGSRPSFGGDRRRDADLTAAGLTVVRVSWRQIMEERMRTVVRLGQVLARASARA